MKNYFYLLISFALCKGVFAQSNDSKLKITDLYVMTGYGTNIAPSSTIDDFKLLAPQSSILNDEFSDYSTMNSFGYSTNGIFTAKLGFENKKKPQRQWQIGLAFFDTYGLSTSMAKEQTWRTDTLTSSQTGNQTYIDSVHTDNVYAQYQAQQLRLDFSLIFRSNTNKRWMLYTGIGATAGVSLNAKTTIRTFSYSSNVSSNTITTEGYPFYRSYGEYQAGNEEEWTNKTSVGASAYIPLGADFKIGKKREFWQPLHLFVELRPGITFQNTPELGNTVAGSLQNGIGLRMSL